MNINAALDRLERRASEIQSEKRRNEELCQCPEFPLIRLVAVDKDGKEHYPSADEEAKARKEHAAKPGERCLRCGKLLPVGKMKWIAFSGGKR